MCSTKKKRMGKLNNSMSALSISGYLHYVIMNWFIFNQGLSKGYSRWDTVAPPINLWEVHCLIRTDEEVPCKKTNKQLLICTYILQLKNGVKKYSLF